MTRDEHRNACLMAVATAMCGAGWETLPERDVLLAHAVKIFDSLYRVARVVPIEATEEMIEASPFNNGPLERIWRAMATAGDLTDPPEPKP